MSDEPAGLAIPFRIVNGRAVLTAGTAKLEENLVHILLTRVGERPMRRDFGGGLHDLLHDPDDEALRALLRHRLASAVAQWEPRVELQAVLVDRRDDVLYIDLGYTVRGTFEPRDLSVPVSLQM